MSVPQLVVELSLSQTEAISSTSSNTPEGTLAKSVIYSAKEDVVHECKINNNISSEVTGSSDSDRAQGQGQGRYGKKRPFEPDGEGILHFSTFSLSFAPDSATAAQLKRQNTPDSKPGC